MNETLPVPKNIPAPPKMKAPKKSIREQRDLLLSIMVEVDEYLSVSRMENIGSGSILHRKMKEAIEQTGR